MMLFFISPLVFVWILLLPFRILFHIYFTVIIQLFPLDTDKIWVSYQERKQNFQKKLGYLEAQSRHFGLQFKCFAFQYK